MTIKPLLLLLLSACSGESLIQVTIADPMGEQLVAVSVGEQSPKVQVVPMAGGLEPSAVVRVDDELLVADFATGNIEVLDALDFTHLRTERENRPGAARVEEPCSLEVVGQETWLLGNDSRNLVVEERGGARREFGSERPIRRAHGVARTQDHLYVSTSPMYRDFGLVQVIDLHDGRLVDHFAPYGEIEDGTAIVLDGETLVVADYVGNQVVRYDLDGSLLGVLVDGDDGLDRPVAMQQLNGVVYILDRNGLATLDDGGFERLITGSELGLQFGRGLWVQPVEDEGRAQ